MSRNKPSVSIEQKHDPLDEVARDLARRIQEKAEERAARRTEDVLHQVLEIVTRFYPGITDPEKQKSILREVLDGKTGKELILAEISRMNNSIAFLASSASESQLDTE